MVICIYSPVRDRRLMTYEEYIIDVFGRYYPWLKKPSPKRHEGILTKPNNPFHTCFIFDGLMLQVYSLKWMDGEVWKCVVSINLCENEHAIKIENNPGLNQGLFSTLVGETRVKKIKKWRRLKSYHY